MNTINERNVHRGMYSRHYAPEHRVFHGHFPDRPLMPGVFYFREILAYLPPEISCLPYMIKHARFIKMVLPGTSLNYVIQCIPASAGKIEVITEVADCSKKTVAKIHFIFNTGEQNAG